MANAAESLAREVADLRRRLAALERGPQIAKSTVPDADGAPVSVVDGIRAGLAAGTAAAQAIEAAASALAKADGAVESFFGEAEPEGKLGDFWRTPDGTVLQHDGEGWAAIADPEVRADLDDALGRLADTEGALDGKISTYFAPLASPPLSPTTGDLWLVSDEGNRTRRYNGTKWIDATLGTDALQEGAVTASKLEADLVLASRVIAGDPTGIRAEMTPKGFKVYGKASGDTSENDDTYEIVRLGVEDTNDMFAIADKDGLTKASISETGIISGKAVYASDDIVFKGDSLSELVWSLPKGQVASAFRYNDSAYNAKAGGEWAPYLRLDVEVERDRLYKVSTSPIRYGQDVGGNAEIRIVQQTGGIATTGSVVIDAVNINQGQDGNSVMLSEIAQLGGAKKQTDGGGPGNKVQASWLIMFRSTKGQFGIRATGFAPVRLLVEDLGPLQNTFTGVHLDTTSTNGVPPTPPPAKAQYTKEWACNWIKSFTGTGAYYPMGDKGYQGLSPAGYGNLKSVMLFPDMTGALSGSVIHEIKVYIYFEHWYYNAGGTARIGLYGTGYPNSYGGGTVVTTSGGWPKPGGRWVTLPTNYYAGFQSGQYRGITLEGDGTYGTYGIAQPPRIQITYTK